MKAAGGFLGGLFVSILALGASEIEKPDSMRSIWAGEPGSGFQENTFQFGAAAGGGFGARIYGTTRVHDFALGYLNAGWIFTEPLLPTTWLKGNWELRAEILGGIQLRPERYVVGATFPSFRYHLASGTHFVPFIQFGVGGTATNIKGPDLSTTFQFNLHAGAGVNYFVTDGAALSLEYRLFHLSNAGIEQPNAGVNTHLILAGVSFWF